MHLFYMQLFAKVLEFSIIGEFSFCYPYVNNYHFLCYCYNLTNPLKLQGKPFYSKLIKVTPLVTMINN